MSADSAVVRHIWTNRDDEIIKSLKAQDKTFEQIAEVLSDGGKKFTRAMASGRYAVLKRGTKPIRILTEAEEERALRMREEGKSWPIIGRVLGMSACAVRWRLDHEFRAAWILKRGKNGTIRVPMRNADLPRPTEWVQSPAPNERAVTVVPSHIENEMRRLAALGHSRGMIAAKLRVRYSDVLATLGEDAIDHLMAEMRGRRVEGPLETINLEELEAMAFEGW